MIHLIETAHAGVITDAPSFQQIGTNVLIFLLSTAGIIAIIALVIAGTMYFFSAGDERKTEVAKQAAKYSVIGIILALSGAILVRTIGQFFQ
jgi:hypothetical protein